MNLTISHLSKQYRRDFWGLHDFDLELKPGVIGLLGPNGAGKSTLMRILATITQPTIGKCLERQKPASPRIRHLEKKETP